MNSKNESENKYCCGRFGGNVENAGKRGIAIVPKRDVKFGDFFFLVFRAIAASDSLITVEPSDVLITVQIEQAIQFCPWCGNNLREYYRDTFETLPFVTETS